MLKKEPKKLLKKLLKPAPTVAANEAEKPPAEKPEPAVSAALLQERIDSLCDAGRSFLYRARKESLEFELLDYADGEQKVTELAEACFNLAQRLHQYGQDRGLNVRFARFSRFGLGAFYKLLKQSGVNLRPVNPVYRLPDLDGGNLPVAQEEAALAEQLASVLTDIRGRAQAIGFEPEDF